MSQQQVIVGLGSCGIAAGANETYAAFKEGLAKAGLDASLSITGCNGLCHREPIVEIITPVGQWTYADVKAPRVAEIIERHLLGGEPILDWTFQGPALSRRSGRLYRQAGLPRAAKLRPHQS